MAAENKTKATTASVDDSRPTLAVHPSFSLSAAKWGGGATKGLARCYKCGMLQM